MPKKPKKPTRDLAWGYGFVSERKRVDGSIRWQARWYERQADGADKLRSRSFGTKDQAEDFLRENGRDRRDGRYTPVEDMTVGQAVLDYIERGESRWKPITYATYRQRAFTHLIPRLGTIRLAEMTTARVQHWIDQVHRSGNHPKTITESTRLLSSSLAEAARLSIIRHNPVTGVRLPGIPAPTHRTWNDREIATVLATVADDPMWHAVYRVALFTGMRPGELRALTWVDIDLGKRTIQIRRTITRDAANRETVGTSTKTGRARSVAIPASTVEALRVWKVAQARLQLAAETWDDRRFVFTGKHGQYLGGTTWATYQAVMIDRAGVTAIGLHEVRHTNATAELEAGTHPLIVSNRLGHARIETTLNLYSHVSPDLQRSATDALEARIVEAGNTTTRRANE